MNAAPDLDPAAIERLTRLGGEKFTAEMVRLFLSYVSEKLEEARRAQQAGDMAGVARAVHPIKSSAGNVGAMRVQHLATDAEARAKAGERQAVDQLVQALDLAFQTVKPRLQPLGQTPDAGDS
jgi:HPt (histidine-containing phosphotransfer) domain-containing protein